MQKEQTISVKEVLNSSFASTRESARSIIKRIDSEKVTFDFAEITMCSRSFFDELLTGLEEKPNIHFDFVSLSETNQAICNIVKNSRRKRHSLFQPQK